jgi:parvulin-like peptidyl-prolyl isomerase
MSFRNRPVLDRKHRPRWQDELRTQQLIIAGFAAAIAVALGIFAAVAWTTFYNDNLRQVALVHGQTINRAELTKREDLIAAQLSASYIDLAGQTGGVRDQVIQQQLQSLQQAINSIDQIGSNSIVTGIVLTERAPEFGLSVSESDLDAEVALRRTIPARASISLIHVTPTLDEGADPGSQPTDQNWADAEATINDLKSQLDGGADFAQLATDNSDDPSAGTGGLVGWVTADDTVYGVYYAAAEGAEVGDVVGPLKDDSGWYLVKVNDRQAEGDDEQLTKLLDAANISDAEYRDFVQQDMLQGKFRDYFTNTVIGRYAPQREVSQILIKPDADPGAPAPKIQIRHLLAKPLPDAQDQSAATDADWAAALARAEAWRDEVSQPDADWYALAQESDDAGSRTRGGNLGWYDTGTLSTSFVQGFADAVAGLDVGEISEPVKSEFGYHIIEVTDRRVNATELADRLVENLRDDPDTFYQVARDYSEDTVSAVDGGDLGWVLPYQFEPQREDVIFGLTEVGQISDPITTDTGIYIFKLTDSSPSRWVSQARRDQVTGSGFSRWLNELQDQAGVWMDPDLAPASSTGGSGTDGLTP